jgi:hypothetical protein
VLAIIGADVIENISLAWSCVAAINAELEAVRDRRSAEAVTELAMQIGVQLSKENERAEKCMRQLEDAILQSQSATESMQLLAKEEMELAGPRMSSTDLHADLASKAIEAAKAGQQRHSTNAIFFMLRVGCPALAC